MSSIVPATVLVAVGSTELGYVFAGKPPLMKPVIGGFVLGIGLYALEGINDRLGRLFCILVITASLLLNGGPIFKKLNGGK